MKDITQLKEHCVLLKNAQLQALIDLNGGMLAQLEYSLPNAKIVSILHTAPWLKEDYFADPPRLDDHLAGEWACVPFGWVKEDTKLFKAQAAHGLPCHSRFTVVEQGEDFVKLEYNYPVAYPLSKLFRTIKLEGSNVHLSFELFAREACETTMGVHPVFPLTGSENELELDIAGEGVVYAIECEAGISRFVTSAVAEDLASIPLKPQYQNKDGNEQYCSLRHLPLPYDTEEIVQMLHPHGEAKLKYANKGVAIRLVWDEDIMPSCLLWVSNRGRKYEPWNGKNCCLGIEPIACAWDLPLEALGENVIKEAGVHTSVRVSPEKSLVFNYALEISALA